MEAAAGSAGGLQVSVLAGGRRWMVCSYLPESGGGSGCNLLAEALGGGLCSTCLCKSYSGTTAGGDGRHHVVFPVFR